MGVIEIAHRGCWAHSDIVKENTLEAFEASLENNFDMIELDIQLTKDEKIVIFHDTYILLTHFVIDLTYEEIQSIDAKIPLLEDLFSMFEKKNIDSYPVYLDIKGTKRIVPHLVNFINQRKESYDISKIIIGSFNILMIEEMYKLAPNFNYGIISETMFPIDILKIFIDKFNLHFFVFHWSILQHTEIKYLHDQNILVFTYTNKLDLIQSRMEQFDVDGIVTNYKIYNV